MVGGISRDGAGFWKVGCQKVRVGYREAGGGISMRVRAPLYLGHITVKFHSLLSVEKWLKTNKWHHE